MSKFRCARKERKEKRANRNSHHILHDKTMRLLLILIPLILSIVLSKKETDLYKILGVNKSANEKQLKVI